MRHSYATAMLMAGMTPAFCAKQLGHSIEMFLRTYTKWMDGAQNEVEMGRLEKTLAPKSGQQVDKQSSVRRKSLISNEKSVGWPMGLEGELDTGVE